MDLTAGGFFWSCTRRVASIVAIGGTMRPAVEAAGHCFLSEIPNAQTSPGYYFENYPERMQKSPGMEMTGYELQLRERFLLRPVQQAELDSSACDSRLGSVALLAILYATIGRIANRGNYLTGDRLSRRISVLKKAFISAARISGCSSAAKWSPRGNSAQRWML